MKQKLTVLACVGLALLLSTGFAFAQNTITVESKDVNRCATVTVNVTLDNLSDIVNAIGLPLVVNGGTLTAVTAGPALSGQLYAINHQANRVLLNAAIVTPCLAMPGPHVLLTLTIETPTDCSGTVTIGLDDPSLVPSSGLLLTDCDACEVPVDLIPGALTLVNQDPVCGVNNDENLHFSGEILNKQLNASDPDPCDNPVGFSLKAGSPGAVTPDGKYSWNPVCADVGVNTITFIATDQCDSTVECTFDVTVFHNPPTCQDLPLNIVHWRGEIHEVLPGTDDTCRVVPPIWTLLDDGGLGNIAVGADGGFNGMLDYYGSCLDIGTTHVTWQIDDGDFQASCGKDIEVYNTTPLVECPGLDTMNINFVYRDTVFGFDEDVLDQPHLAYSVITILRNGLPAVPDSMPTIDNNGVFRWKSTFNDLVGLWAFEIEITDGCYSSTCWIEIELIQYFVDILDATGTVDTIPTLPGTVACVYIHMNNPNYELGGVDFLLAYDASCLSLQSIGMEDGLQDWEYWTWRTGASGNCEGGCPTGLIRIIAIADLDNGPTIHPPDPAFVLNGNIVEICFLATNDWNFLGECCWIDFYSMDCGDNVLASKDGNTLWMEIGVDPDCLIGGGDGKPVPFEKITYGRGAICLREPNDARGDINLNNIANEVSDAVLFSNYFITGDGVWMGGDYTATQIQATDVNNDGIPLTIADLVYLIRIITGDEMPFPSDNGNPKVSPYAGQADAIVKVNSGNVSITTNSAVDLGGALFVFRYSGMGVGEAVASDAAANMVVKSRADRGELRVLVAPNMADLGTIEAGTHEVVTIPTTGEGTIDLVEVQLADAHGAMLTSNMAKISPPKSYALMQNYPNPFNAGTVIRFDLSKVSDWELQVYNITGQVVRTFSGRDEASTVSVTWDGNDRNGSQAASGVYFYRVNAGDFTATKKMTLVK